MHRAIKCYVIEFINQQTQLPYSWFCSHKNNFERSVFLLSAKRFTEKETAEKALKKLLKDCQYSRPYLAKEAKISKVEMTITYKYID
jgi:hypothetical protein